MIKDQSLEEKFSKNIININNVNSSLEILQYLL